MDLSRYGPSINPLAMALASNAVAPPVGDPASMNSGFPGQGGQGGQGLAPGIPPGVMPPPVAPPPPITSTGVPQLPSAIGASPSPQMPSMVGPRPLGGVGASPAGGPQFGFGGLGQRGY